MIIDDDNTNNNTSDQIPTPSDVNIKRKRRPAGTPDPEAEVVSLSPRTLLESDRYLCEICGQGFQREQNLQMHRRRHKVPWKLLKRPENGGGAARKRVYVCPETTCLHHQAAHALGDLVGIKKHFRRKHSGLRQWTCAKCSKAYAVHSDFKAHLKTCGTRGHSCDCGRVFSRVESFIEHQDACSHTGPSPTLPAVCLSPPEGNNNGGTVLKERRTLMTTTTPFVQEVAGGGPNHSLTGLRLSIGPSDFNTNKSKVTAIELPLTPPSQALAGAGEGEWDMEVRQAEVEKAYAESARREAKAEMEKAEREFSNARRIRQHARAELDKAYALKDHAAHRIREALLQITCHACRTNVHVIEAAPESDSPPHSHSHSQRAN